MQAKPAYLAWQIQQANLGKFSRGRGQPCARPPRRPSTCKQNLLILPGKFSRAGGRPALAVDARVGVVARGKCDFQKTTSAGAAVDLKPDSGFQKIDKFQ